jgi:hypothetical protein
MRAPAPIFGGSALDSPAATSSGPSMPISERPYRQKTFATVKGNRMAYIEYGGGDIAYAPHYLVRHGGPCPSEP